MTGRSLIFDRGSNEIKRRFIFIDRIEDLSAMPSLAMDVMAMLNDPAQR